MASVRHSAPADGSFTTAGASAWNELHVLSNIPAQASIDALSNAISVVSQQVSVLSARADTISNAASNALSVANAASQAVSVVSQALSVEIVARAAGDASVWSAVSVIRSAVSARSAGNVSTKGVQSILDALSNRISIGGGTGSVTSNEASAISAQAASAINVVSNAVSIVSNAASNALSVANAASNKASAISAGLASLSIRSAGASVKGLQSVLNVISNQFSNSFSAGNVLSQNFVSVQSTVSHLASVISLASVRSVGNVSTKGLQSVLNALSNRISAGGGGSVTSNEVSAVSQQASVNDASIWSAVSVLRSAITVRESATATSTRGMQSIIDALSRRISAEAPLGGGGGSVTSTEVSAVSQTASVNLAAALNVSIRSAVGGGGAASVKGLQSILNAISNTLSDSFSAGNVVSANVVSLQSTVSHYKSVLDGASVRSVGGISTKGLQSTLNALSNRISATGAGVASVTSNEASAISNQASINDASIWTAVSILRSVVSARSVGAVSTRGMQSILDALSNRISVGGGTGSVTSNEASAISNQASVNLAAALNVSAVSAATTVKGLQSIINQLSNRTSVLSQAISVVSNAASAADAHASVASLAATSVDGRIASLSAAEASLSARSVGGVSTHGMQSILNALSNRISAVPGGTGSVTSNEASAISNQASVNLAAALNVSAVSAATSVKGLQSIINQISNRTSVLSNAISVVSTAASNALSVANAASQAASVVSNAASNALSVANAASQAASVVSNAASNALSVANAASNAASVVSNELSNVRSVLSQRISALSIDALKGVSISAVTSTHVLKWISAAAEWQNAPDATAGGGGSVTSTEASAISQTASVNLAAALNVSILSVVGGGGASSTSVKGLQSILNAISNTLSNSFSAGNVVSADVASIKSVISAKVPWNVAKHMIVSNTQSMQTSALADVSGMVLTVAADETWRINGMLLFSTSAAAAGFKLGCSVPPLSTPRFGFACGPQGAGLQSAPAAVGGGQLQVSGASVLYSTTSTTPAGSPKPVKFEFIFNVASAGTFRLMTAGIVSVAGSPLHILAGTHMMCYRLK